MKTNTLREIKLVAGLLVLLAIPVSVSSWFRDEASLQLPISAESLQELATEYKKNGIEPFKDAKKLLQKRVSLNLRNDDDPQAQMAAMNIAVYLFPELLHDTNLEKQYAQEHFKPLQDKIELLPGTQEAQTTFEELRNTVWNYENPKETEQGLSNYAAEMLKVYGALSWK